MKMSLTLWNHNMLGAYPVQELKNIPGVWRYSARVLASTLPDDILQLPSDLKDQFDLICQHYRSLGLRHASNIIWDDDLEICKSYPNYFWNTFLFSEEHHLICPNERLHSIVKKMNNKNYFIRLCQQNGWPVPETICFNSQKEFKNDCNVKFPCFVKVGCSASGAGVLYCDDWNSLKSNIDLLESEVDFQIQQPVTDAVFLNVQYDAQNGKLSRKIYTEQVLEGFSHAGNKWPSNFEERPWELCDPIAHYMVEQGMQGPFAFDVAVSNERFFLIECNPRFNGCTYYSQVAEKIKAHNWIARNLSVKTDSLSGLSLDGLVWDAQKKTGLIIISWGTILQN